METVLGITDLQIRLFTAIGQIAVAGIVGYIAWQQWRTAKKKLKADLFDRRHALYRSIRDALGRIREGTDIDSAIRELRTSASEMQWVYSRDLSQWVKSNIVRPAAKAGRLSQDMESLLADAFRDGLMMERIEALGLLDDALEEFLHRVEPFLSIHH